jgi:hypothetical protein
VIYEDICSKNDIVMMIETGCINKLPMIEEKRMKIVVNNEATTNKKEKYVHLGIGSAIIAKKEIIT